MWSDAGPGLDRGGEGGLDPGPHRGASFGRVRGSGGSRGAGRASAAVVELGGTLLRSCKRGVTPAQETLASDDASSLCAPATPDIAHVPRILRGERNVCEDVTF